MPLLTLEHGVSDHWILKSVPGHTKSIASWNLASTFGPLAKLAKGWVEQPKLLYSIGRNTVLQVDSMKCGTSVTFERPMLLFVRAGCVLPCLVIFGFVLVDFEDEPSFLTGERGCFTLALVGTNKTWSSTSASLLISAMYYICKSVKLSAS